MGDKGKKDQDKKQKQKNKKQADTAKKKKDKQSLWDRKEQQSILIPMTERLLNYEFF